MSKIFNPKSTLHKILTYGVALAIIVLCFIFCKGEAAPEWGWLIVGFLFYYAIVSRRILETLIIAGCIGVLLMYGNGAFVDGMVEQFYNIMESEDFVWMVLNCALFNVFMKLLAKTGSEHAFGAFAKKYAKDRKSCNLITWLMQFPLFFDDFLHIIVLGQTMTPIYDEVDAPREDESFLIQTLGEPIRELVPFTGWLPFMSGLFMIEGIASDSSEAVAQFCKTIPFNFYCWIAEIGALLFALGVIPKLGASKHPDKSKYKSLEDIASDTAEAAGEEPKKRGGILDFIIPLVISVLLSWYFDWDLIPACVIVIPVFAVYFLVRGLLQPKDIEDSIVEGTADLTNMYILVFFSYILSGLLQDMGFIDYLVEVAQQIVVPQLLPFAVYAIFCVTEAAMSLNWSMMMIVFPVMLPVALGIGANVPLTAAAIISAGAFGQNWCFICDFCSMTSSFVGLPTDYHARNCMNYSLIFAALAGVLFLVGGFIF